MFGHFQTASIFKQSVSNLKVWELRHWEVIKFVNDNQIKSVLDLGCNEGKLLQKLQRGIQASLLVGLDIDIKILQQAKLNVHPQPLQKNLMMDRQNEQKVKLYHGSALNKQKQLKQMNFQLITLIQVIQHLYPEQINDLSQNIFSFINPQYVIITTPNKDFNYFFQWQNDKMMRHEDHKFQWTRAQFQHYVTEVSAKYNYKYTIYGVGQHISDDSRGFCTQIALFQKRQSQSQQIFQSNSQPALSLVCQYTNMCWKNCQQQLLKQAIYNSLMYYSDRVEWEQALNYLKKTRICKLLSGDIHLQQSFSNGRTDYQNSIVTKQFLINLFKTMNNTIVFDQYGYERSRQLIQEQFLQDWNEEQDIQNLPLNDQAPKQCSPFFYSNSSRSLQQSFNSSFQFSTDSRNTQQYHQSSNSNKSYLYSNLKERNQNIHQQNIEDQFPRRLIKVNNECIQNKNEKSNINQKKQDQNSQSDQDSWN